MLTSFLRKKKFIVTEPDPVYDVLYLGNVVTILAKGEGCYEKAISLIWKTYCSRTRPDLRMELTITRSGLKALTKQQGLTEYWAHRITFCVAPANYPRVFVWIYKHEGKRMKPELRCHAVLCKKPDLPPRIAVTLHEKILTALKDYKREKICRQNIRLAASSGGFPTLPRRKLLLTTGGQNFRPPMERSKSAPKLQSIEEEEDAELLFLAEICENEEILEFTAPTSPLAEYESGTPVVEDSPKLRLDEENNIVFVPEILRATPKIEYGNDIEALKLECRIRSLKMSGRGALSLELDSDTVSDESGYHEEKSSIEDDEHSLELDSPRLVTAL